jgi:hypothetical protein
MCSLLCFTFSIIPSWPCIVRTLLLFYLISDEELMEVIVAECAPKSPIRIVFLSLLVK